MTAAERPPDAPRATRREWIGLAVLALPCMLYSMDLTVLNLALPHLSAALRPSGAELLWIVDIYGFLVAGALITMGTLGDRIGRRRLLMFGAVAFGIGSTLAALSSTPAQLIASRALLGLAGATLAPSTLSLIRNMFLDAGQRTFAISIWVMSYSVGGAIGPLVGGALLEHFAWNAVFWLALPVMAVLLALGPWLLPEFRDPNAGRLDVISAAWSLVAVLAAIYGLKSIAQHGVQAQAFVAIGVGVALGIAFVRRQRTLAHPLIDVTLFARPAFAGAVAINVLACFTVFGAFILLAQGLQSIAGMSPWQAGLWMVPSSLGFVLGSSVTPWLARRVARSSLIAVSLALAALACVGIACIDMRAAFVPFIVVWCVFSTSLAPLFTLTTDAIVSAAPPERAGAASAISETGAEFGGALGIAVLGSLGAMVYRNAIEPSLVALPGGTAGASAQAARDTIGGAVAVAQTLPAPIDASLLDAARAAFLHATSVSFAVSAASLGAMTVVILAARRHLARTPGA